VLQCSNTIWWHSCATSVRPGVAGSRWKKQHQQEHQQRQRPDVGVCRHPRLMHTDVLVCFLLLTRCCHLLSPMYMCAQAKASSRRRSNPFLWTSSQQTFQVRALGTATLLPPKLPCTPDSLLRTDLSCWSGRGRFTFCTSPSVQSPS
jgi:hypothetical protein